MGIRIILQAHEEELRKKDDQIEVLKETIRQQKQRIRHFKNRF